VAIHSGLDKTSLMTSNSRHVARSPRSPAHPAGSAPLSPGRAPAAERRVVRRRTAWSYIAISLSLVLALSLSASAATQDERKSIAIVAFAALARGQSLGPVSICERAAYREVPCPELTALSAEESAELEEWQLQACPELIAPDGAVVSGTDELFVMWWACRPIASAFLCASTAATIFHAEEILLSSKGSQALVAVWQQGYPNPWFGSGRLNLVELAQRDGSWYVRGLLSLGRE
jgi:hypothetical protein